MSFKLKFLLKSPWVFHMSTGSCNNCDIELIDVLTPRYDAERFGIVLVGSIKHADVLMVTGSMNMKCIPRVKEVYAQAPKPILVVALGACSCGRGIFRDSYNCPQAVDEIIPIDVYVPGCPPKPEAIIAGILKGMEKLKS